MGFPSGKPVALVEDIGAALQRRIVALQPSYPGIAVEAVGSEWRIAIPDALRIGHDAAFAAFTRRFLAQVTPAISQRVGDLNVTRQELRGLRILDGRPSVWVRTCGARLRCTDAVRSRGFGAVCALRGPAYPPAGNI